MAKRRVTVTERFAYLEPKSRDAVVRFSRHLTFQGYAPTSILNSLYKVDRFLRAGRLQDVYQVGGQAIERFIQQSQQAGLAGSTINGILSGIHHLYRYLRDEGEVAQNPVEFRKHRVRVPHRLPRPMRDEAVRALFTVIVPPRDRALFLLMLRCGLRVSEVARLPVTALDFTQHTVRITHGKGGIERVVYSSVDVEHSLREWLALRAGTSAYLFPSEVSAEEPVSVRTIQRAMRRYLQDAGLGDQGYSPHTLRHTYATQLLNAGVGLRTLQELMGHQTITMTMGYVKLYDQTKRDEYFAAMQRIQQRHTIR